MLSVAVALTNGDAIVLIVALALPLGLISFLGAGAALEQIGKGPLSLNEDMPQSSDSASSERLSAAEREEEIRQFLEAKSYRREAKGEAPLNVEAELERLLAESATTSSLTADAELVAEVRELVVASNARRERMGKEQLDVDAEVARQLTELESLGQ